LRVSQITQIASGSLGAIKGLGGYAFDARGNRFDYRHGPSRMGYVVQYSGMVEGVGKFEVDYWVQDQRTKLVLTPSTKVEGEAVIKSVPIGHEVFGLEGLAPVPSR
jgi:hypothetical protein